MVAVRGLERRSTSGIVRARCLRRMRVNEGLGSALDASTMDVLG
jgi:hypothetical protein